MNDFPTISSLPASLPGAPPLVDTENYIALAEHSDRMQAARAPGLPGDERGFQVAA